MTGSLPPIGAPSAPLAFCIAEDRPSCEPALRILIASLLEHIPDADVILFAPNATGAFKAWLQARPQVRRQPGSASLTARKYDVKPSALLKSLEIVSGPVIWLDSDLIVTCDFRHRFMSLSNDVLVVTEEALGSSHADDDAMRARLWALPIGRALPFLANTGVVRVTPKHVPLLTAWDKLLASAEYLEAQSLTWDKRPLHLMGDQEVLTALLCAQAFSDIPLSFLRRGLDIVQYFGSSGYTLSDRVSNIFVRPPCFIHSQGFRPWWPRSAPASSWSARFLSLYNDLSPYTLRAKRYAAALETTDWLSPPSIAAALFRALSFGFYPLVGLPLAVVSDLVRLVKFSLARYRRRTASVHA